VHLVDEVDLEGAARGGVGGVLAKGANALDAVVAGAVDLDDVEAASLGDLDAGVADAARVVGRLALVGEAVEGLGQGYGRRRSCRRREDRRRGRPGRDVCR